MGYILEGYPIIFGVKFPDSQFHTKETNYHLDLARAAGAPRLFAAHRGNAIGRILDLQIDGFGVKCKMDVWPSKTTDYYVLEALPRGELGLSAAAWGSSMEVKNNQAFIYPVPPGEWPVIGPHSVKTAQNFGQAGATAINADLLQAIKGLRDELEEMQRKFGAIRAGMEGTKVVNVRQSGIEVRSYPLLEISLTTNPKLSLTRRTLKRLK